MNEINIKRSWIEINLEQIKKNYHIYKSCIPNEVMAVVKSDAYGHGATEVSKILQNEGVKAFAVSNVIEAVELRENGINGLILILGYTPIDSLDLVERYKITQALISEEYANDVIASGKRIRCHYAIDTGMNRVGLNADNKLKCKQAIETASKHLQLTGIFTHLCVADISNQSDFTREQITKFKNVAETVKNLNLSEVHCLNSAGGLWYQTRISCFSRLGIVLYGLKPNYCNVLPQGIEPALEWKSVVSMIKDVYPGETIGYGRTFKAKNKMRIATIPTGYADGYSRELSNKGIVYINGKRAPVVGSICMDQFMVDVTHISNVNVYDEVMLLCSEFNADEMAKLLNTIGYELICRISRRVGRVYINSVL